MSRYLVFHIVGLLGSVFIGFSAAVAHNDPLLKVGIVLTLIFFAGACVAWDINEPLNPKEEDQ